MDWAHSEGAFHNHITAFLEKYKHYFPSFSGFKERLLNRVNKENISCRTFVSSCFHFFIFLSCNENRKFPPSMDHSCLFSFEYYFSCDSLFHATGQGSRHIEIESVVWQSF